MVLVIYTWGCARARDRLGEDGGERRSSEREQQQLPHGSTERRMRLRTRGCSGVEFAAPRPPPASSVHLDTRSLTQYSSRETKNNKTTIGIFFFFFVDDIYEIRQCVLNFHQCTMHSLRALQSNSFIVSRHRTQWFYLFQRYTAELRYSEPYLIR